MNKKLIYLISITIVCIVLSMLPTPEGLTRTGHLSIVFMMAAVLFWVTEVVPICFAAILFTVLPAVFKIAPVPVMMGNFATPTVFFVFAMFILSISFQKSGLSERIVLLASIKSKGSPEKMLFYMMMACALLSTVLADIPVMAMMLPMALVILKENGCKPGASSFGKAVMIGLPFASLIGGVGTPAGSAMNAMTIGILKETANVHITFLEWACLGIPMVLILTPIAWYITTRVYASEVTVLQGLDKLEDAYHALGRLTKSEMKFVVIMGLNILVWVTDTIHHIPLPIACVLGATLFLLPGVDLIDWKEDKNKIGWDVLMVIGASNSLGVLLWEQGAASWIASNCLSGISDLPLWSMIAIISFFTVVVHLLVPVNTALVAVMVPALVALSTTIGINPSMLAIPLGFSVSAALILPLDPVPLITYNAGFYKMTDMCKPGLVLSVFWVIVMTLVMLVIAKPLGLM